MNTPAGTVAALGMVCLLASCAVLRAEQGSSRLLEAAKRGDQAAVLALVNGHVPPNSAEPDGTTALHWMVRAGAVEAVRALLAAGASADTANRYGVTPLMLAAMNGDAETIRMLLDAGADANHALPEGQTVLMTAARTGRVEALRELIAHGADVNARERWLGETALMWAAAENHADAVTWLGHAGAEVDAHARTLEFPKAKVDFATMVSTAMPRGGLTPLMYAARQGAKDAARALVDLGADLNATDPDGTSALVLAIINAHYDVASLLIRRGADTNVADVAGMAALYAAVDMHTLEPMVNRPPPTPTGPEDSIDIVKLLLDRGAQPDARLKARLLQRQHNAGDPSLGRGATPLMRAAKSGDVTLMKLLLAAGADPALRTAAGMTTLMFAAGTGRKTDQAAIEAIRLCLDRGIDIDAVDDQGQSALHLAVEQSDAVVKFLAERGARLDLKDRNGRTPLDIALGVSGTGRGRSGTVRETTAAVLREFSEGRGVGATGK